METEGLDQAKRVYGELMDAFMAVKETVEREKIDCHYRQQGRLLLATSSAMHEAMAREFALRENHLGEPFETVTRDFSATRSPRIITSAVSASLIMRGFIPGSITRDCWKRPARPAYKSRHAPVLGFRREPRGFTVFLKGARVEARDLIFATNGYGGSAWPWLMRRLLPFHAYQAVSAPLGENCIASLLPGDRTFIDWNFNVDWMRRAPGDPTRIVFGGLTGEIDADLRVMAERLQQRLLRIFPDLSDLRFDHVWTGRCSGTFDINPRIGVQDGVHFAGGYCFAGVPMGTLFGQKLARRILGHKGGESVFDRPLETRFFYRGNAWFVPHAIRWMSRNDR